MLPPPPAGWSYVLIVAVAALFAVPALGPNVAVPSHAASTPLKVVPPAWFTPWAPPAGFGSILTLAVNTTQGFAFNAPFYGLNVQVNFTTNTLAAMGQFFNSTPLTVFRINGGSDSYDPTTQVEYVPPASGSGKYVSIASPQINFTWFRAWCLSLTPHCQWMANLPAEENDTQAAIHWADWFHTVLKFVPTYWEFGNEPEAWTHYGINFTKWSTSDSIAPTPAAYATMEKNYIAAVSAKYPSDHYIGIQAPCACDPTMIAAVAQVNGQKVSALAYHNYPWANNSSVSIAPFYQSLFTSKSVLDTSTHFRSLFNTSCVRCASLPIQVGEYQAGPVPTHSPFSDEYGGAVFMAVSVIQAIEANISTFTVFQLSDLFNASDHSLAPEGVLYQQILDNLTHGTAYGVNITSALAPGGITAMYVRNGSREAMLVVNTNVSRAVVVDLPTSLFPATLSGSYWYWSPRIATPGVHTTTLLPTSFYLGQQSILLVANY